MRNITKKIVIYSMVGLMQVGLGTAAVMASPLHSDGSAQIVQLDRHDRDRHEHYRHDHRNSGNDDNTMNVIAAGAIGFVLGSATN